MSDTKQFHLGDILSVTTGRLVSPRHMSGIYDILNWMTSESLFTHQLSRVSREADPVLKKFHPWLSDINDEFESSQVEAWLSDQVAKYGEMHAVPKMSVDEHERIDALSELAEKIHPDKIIIVESGS